MRYETYSSNHKESFEESVANIDWKALSTMLDKGSFSDVGELLADHFDAGIEAAEDLDYSEESVSDMNRSASAAMDRERLSDVRGVLEGPF